LIDNETDYRHRNRSIPGFLLPYTATGIPGKQDDNDGYADFKQDLKIFKYF